MPSGDGCSFDVSAATLVRELKASVQKHFQRRLKLTAEGRQLDVAATATSPESAPLLFFCFFVFHPPGKKDNLLLGS